MPAQLIIQMDDQGRCQVTGPINNKLVAYGMLELARETIARFHEQRTSIQPAQAIALDAIDRMKGE